MKEQVANKKVVWLVGASTGIGEALAHQLAHKLDKQGGHLIISARSESKLKNIASLHPNVSVVTVDVTDQKQVNDAGILIEAKFSALDLVIFNSGTCEYIDVEDFSSSTCQQVMTTNFFGLTNIVEVALPLLSSHCNKTDTKEKSQLAIVSSSVSVLPMTKTQAYGASKAAVSYFAEAMKLDLAKKNIDVSLISPGFVKTPLTDRNDFPMPMKISVDEAAGEIIRGLDRRLWDIHFPKRFTWILRTIVRLPVSIKHKILLKMQS